VGRLLFLIRVLTSFIVFNAEVRHGGNNAYYATNKDYIQLPHFEFFKDSESYYATRLHETVHWTRHPTPVNVSIFLLPLLHYIIYKKVRDNKSKNKMFKER